MTTRAKLLTGLGVYLGGALVLLLIFGMGSRDDEFQPTDEYRLEPWIPINIGGLDLSVNRAVFYLLFAAALTVGGMMYIANRMAARPNRVQTAIEALYGLMKDNITEGNMDRRMATRWFTFVGTLFMFIWISNVIGYIPLPTNTSHPVNILGVDIPTFGIYAATANISCTLILTLVVWITYHVEGIRAQGVVDYFKSWVPAGVAGAAAVPLFLIEIISHFVRIISLSVRLFANILAGHLLILFMGGGLAVLLGGALIGWVTLPAAVAFFLFELVLIATLQAFIFATLTAIYFGSAAAPSH